MNQGNKINWLAGLAAGVAALALVGGCQSDRVDVVSHGEEFPSDDSVRYVHETQDLEAANAARADGTLRAYHFDRGELNSLGEDRLNLMLRNGDSTNPMVVYLDVPSDDLDNTRRQQAVLAYLKDHGLTDEQIQFKAGPNPNVNSPVAPILAANGGTASAAPSAGGGAAPAGPSMGAH